MALKDLPADAQPREKLLARGPAALADAELLAILLRTGIVGKGVLQMAQDAGLPPGEGTRLRFRLVGPRLGALILILN
eukprot:gene2913-3830_t